MNVISFPGLGIGPLEINRVALKLGPLTVYWYGLIICLGLVLGLCYLYYRIRKFGMNSDNLTDIAIFTIPSAIIGARLYYVLTSLEEYHSFYDVIAIWEGGIAIYGAVIAGAVAVYLVCRIKKFPTMKVFDSIAPAVMLGQAIGRWGNFCNGEAFGSETTLPWRMGLCNSETNFKTLYVHPTFFYESIWNIIGFIWINIFYRKRKYHGEIMIWYFCWYGLGRAFIELLRTDSLMIGNIRVSSLLSFLLVLLLLPAEIFLRHLCKKYTEEGLLQAGEITSLKTIITIFINKKKGNEPLSGIKKNEENADTAMSENKNPAEAPAE